MILIDAVFIHTGGGKSLLDYLVSEINKTEADVFYLLDQRYQPQESIRSLNNVEFIDGFFNRCKFYSRNRSKFNTVFCLGNIPPHIKLTNSRVIMYLHSVSYLSSIIQNTMQQKILQYIKKKIFYALVGNADFWMVQTKYIQNLFQKNVKISVDKIRVLPFFKIIEKNLEIIHKEKNSFFYPGSAEPHKNHKRIIDAFCLFYDRYKTGHLYLTVDERFPDIFDYISVKNKKSYPIYNLGYLSDKNDIRKLYSKSEYLVFPSLQESFGLPLIEATEFDCKIISANLNYVTQVCVPSYTFDPYSIISMSEAFENVFNNEHLPKSYAIVHNEINQIINIIQNIE